MDEFDDCNQILTGSVHALCKLGFAFFYYPSLLRPSTRRSDVLELDGYPEPTVPEIPAFSPSARAQSDPINVELSPSKDGVLLTRSETADSGSEKERKKRKRSEVASRTTSSHLSFISFFIPRSFMQGPCPERERWTFP